MMGGGRFILLKAGRRGAESAQQAEVRLADLLKILCICRGAANLLAEGETHMRWLCGCGFPRGMANRPQIAPYVIQITVLAEKMAQYRATRCRGKLSQVYIM
jgi:hypothetical protein